MYGAGNIGRGFIGKLFSESGYEVVFIDINPVVLEKINNDRSYPVRIVSEGSFYEDTVKNVRAVSAADIELVAQEISTCDIMATAVGVNVLPRIIKPVAAGLKKRWADKNPAPLDIIICENLLDANHYLAKLLKQELNEYEAGLFEEKIGLVEASIGRMVPVMTAEMQEGNPLRVWVEPYSVLPVDKAAFKGDIPEIKNMVPFSPFDFYIQRKLFLHNMAHALASYLGFLNNSTYIWEALKNPYIKLITAWAMQESAVAMSLEHNVHTLKLISNADDLIYRFCNKLLGDTVERVGKDPVRKLSGNDRMIGAVNLCMKHGVVPVYISIGIAAGFLFAPAGDEAAAKVQQTVKEQGIGEAIRLYCSIDAAGPIADLVKEFYSMLKNGALLEEVLERAEKIKNDSYKVKL